MKRGTPQHPKVGGLMTALELPRYAAVGLLESLWHFTAMYAPSGDLSRYSNMAIALAVDWRGDADKLFDVLVQERWLDRSEHRLIVHDWHEHCDDGVHAFLAARGLRFASGAIPSTRRLNREQRQRLADRQSAGIATTGADQSAGVVATSAVASASASASASAKKSTSCPEAESTPLRPDEPALMVFPCVGKDAKSWNLTEPFLAIQRQAFPDLDVMRESRKALAWVVANSSKRKTAGGMPKFLNHWFEHAQNGASAGAAFARAAQRPGRSNERPIYNDKR